MPFYWIYSNVLEGVPTNCNNGEDPQHCEGSSHISMLYQWLYSTAVRLLCFVQNDLRRFYFREEVVLNGYVPISCSKYFVKQCLNYGDS